jgi:hypothetical protein
MIKIGIMKYKVITDIPETYDGIGANVGDILTVGWHDSGIESCWGLYKSNNYVCGLGSYFGTRYCKEIKPNV